MVTILSLDPGGTTGYAVLDVVLDTEPAEVVRRGQIEGGLAGFLDFHWDVLDGIQFDQIVCESFKLREGLHGVDLTPTYIIGALEALYPTTPILYQEPKLKPLCDDLRLKKLGLHIPGKPHANDAVRHAIIALRNSKHKATLEAGWKD